MSLSVVRGNGRKTVSAYSKLRQKSVAGDDAAAALAGAFTVSPSLAANGVASAVSRIVAFS